MVLTTVDKLEFLVLVDNCMSRHPYHHATKEMVNSVMQAKG